MFVNTMYDNVINTFLALTSESHASVNVSFSKTVTPQVLRAYLNTFDCDCHLDLLKIKIVILKLKMKTKEQWITNYNRTIMIQVCEYQMKITYEDFLATRQRSAIIKSNVQCTCMYHTTSNIPEP